MLNLSVNSKKFWQTLTVLIAAVILFMTALLAVNSGKIKSKTELVLKNAESTSKALGYFYSDQDRFPSALEFQNANIMRVYLDPFPPAEVVSGNCTESFEYKRPKINMYELYFCLPEAQAKFNKGWNKISVTK